jgi:hypothetical protein
MHRSVTAVNRGGSYYIFAIASEGIGGPRSGDGPRSYAAQDPLRSRPACAFSKTCCGIAFETFFATERLSCLLTDLFAFGESASGETAHA